MLSRIASLKTGLVLWVILAIIAGGCIGWYIRPFSSVSTPKSAQVRVDSPEYRLINPLLFSDNAKSDSSYARELENKLAGYVKESKATSSIQSISIYFRDLNSGQWTGVDEDALYKPSSMLKVLAMMAALKVAESDQSILNERLLFHKEVSGGMYYEGTTTITDGYYSLSKLISVMIESSDNDAFLAIVSDQRINNEFTQAYNMLHLPPAGLVDSASDFMSPKSYATLFRILYNSTFFSWQVSEKVLELLSKTNFDKGLVAGVPANIEVAHKFGENTDELHDCGIIYYPEHPYLLCVMTKGSDLKVLEGIIAGASKTVYNYVNTVRHPS